MFFKLSNFFLENVFCEILPFDTNFEEIQRKKPKGIIFTGGPNVVTEKNAPKADKRIFELSVPILGICYGNQLIGHQFNGKVSKASKKEFGKKEMNVDTNHPLFKGVQKNSVCWMSHSYFVEKVPSNFKIIAKTDTCSVTAMANDDKKLFGEVIHTTEGKKIIRNFLLGICSCSGDWKMEDYAKKAILSLKKKIGKKKVLCGLSGGVDSSVAAVLIHKAIGSNLTCIFVDHGLLRKNEGNEVEKVFGKHYEMNFIRVNTKKQFFSKLKGISDPETKRKIIGEEFIRVFESEAKKIGKVEFLVQGTIYPDVIESGTKFAKVIKSHHNVGGLPDFVDFDEIIEPLRELFKDEVRNLGRVLGIPEEIVSRQPFPGPGLAIRIIGDVTQEKINLLQEADYIYREEIAKAGLKKKIWQYFAVLTGLRSVGVMGDERTYYYTIALRAVTSVDGMTADWARIPYNVLEAISTRIVNEVPNVNRVCYDITSKPPSTIEWE